MNRFSPHKKPGLQLLCRVCQSENLIDILSLGNQYLSDFVSDDSKPAKYPLDLIVCEKCFLLQLRHNAPQTSLYSERYGYKSGMNQTMRDELKQIVEKALKVLPYIGKKLTVVDIGANDGTLLNYYPKSLFRIGVEPVLKFADECGKHANIVIADFFNLTSYKKKVGNRRVDIITAISCFYDMEEPNKFLHDVARILKTNGVFIIQQNYLMSMLQQNAFDNIVHEHLEYYSLLSLENLLRRHDMEVFDVEFSDVNGGSFRTYISFNGKRNVRASVRYLRRKEEKINLMNIANYTAFAKRVENNKTKLVLLLKKLKKEKKVTYIYGASTRGNTLLQYFGIDKTFIKAAVERNPEKWGKKIASVGIPIISEEQARKDRPDYMLVLPWFFKKEFIKREQAYLKNGGHFIFPLPKLTIV